jgi:hypothetical protein
LVKFELIGSVASANVFQHFATIFIGASTYLITPLKIKQKFSWRMMRFISLQNERMVSRRTLVTQYVVRLPMVENRLFVVDKSSRLKTRPIQRAKIGVWGLETVNTQFLMNN